VQTQRADREELARVLRVPLNADGFFVQAHPELRPVDCVREGIFLCDASDAAKSIAQANAVAARAASVLSRKEIQVGGGMTAWVDPQKCISCMTCVHICPFMAPHVGGHNKAEVQDTVCMGCGTCSAECPAKAITLQDYADDQILGAIDSLLAPNVDKKEIVLTYPEQVGIAPPRWHASQTE
jgi:heterodisulfide reductase subunit A-like polyferredoxin